MLFKLHYLFSASGAAAIELLLGVYIKEYTDASSLELGVLLMLMPFTGIILRPMICSMADRAQAYQKVLMILEATVAISYSPFVIIPFLGPQIYQVHPRICWYTLVLVKVVGDIAFTSAWSIGDSLAINYAERTKNDFTSYRLWGTYSWMAFGLFIGQVNEISFLPRYVPAFMILCLSTFLNGLAIWLWPAEYFVMVPINRNRKLQVKEDRKSSLLPREVVLAQMKTKLLWLVTLGFNKNSRMKTIDQTTTDSSSQTKQTTEVQVEAIGKKMKESKVDKIDKRTQSSILMTLVRKEPRLFAYLMFFVCAGASLAPLSFFFISLSNICHNEKTCDYSQLAGMLQVAMACAETFVFVNVTRACDKFGRLNMCGFGILLTSLKYTFYATIWLDVSPYYSLLIEVTHGFSYGIYMVISVEMAHLFANEVEFILPNLIGKGIIEGGEGREEKLKMSLVATMQSLMHSAQDGIGKGFGSLIFGLLLEHYSFETLWLIVAVSAGVVTVIVFMISLLDAIFKFDIGLDVKATKRSDPQDGDKEIVENGKSNIYVVKESNSIDTSSMRDVT